MQKVIIFLLNVQLALRSAGWGQVLMEGHVQEGLAHVCLVGSSTTIQKAKIESSIPRKRGAAAAGYDKALQSFFNKVTCAPRVHFGQCQKAPAETGLVRAVVERSRCLLPDCASSPRAIADATAWRTSRHACRCTLLWSGM